MLAYLQGSDRIVHAGDICDHAVLERLAAIAPVTAVRGNNDWGVWADRLREVERVAFEGVDLLAIHDLARMRLEPKTAGVGVVVSGHSHKPLVETRDGILYVNPGSAGPRRFKLPISVGELLVDGRSVSAHIHEIEGR
ncbi:MAG: metallophosphoesterase family protein [Caldimonas sp.]